ncbi:hypothetical protein PVAP13_8NG273701 [Panicum virgatum]|uniref:Uncharacterized protein n=1 Tax=Panicum virgatum TaxID=38727 RepID=A0A8T0P9S3_PANVG|nr:hypothetical protein PVAP13_8NG273701 [Panicum virgatum]
MLLAKGHCLAPPPAEGAPRRCRLKEPLRRQQLKEPRAAAGRRSLAQPAATEAPCRHGPSMPGPCSAPHRRGPALPAEAETLRRRQPKRSRATTHAAGRRRANKLPAASR